MPLSIATLRQSVPEFWVFIVKHWLKPAPGFTHPLSSMPRLHMVTHRNTHKWTSTHLTHYLNMGDPLSSSFAPLIGQDRQDKVSRFGQWLSDKEGIWFISCHKELLCIGPRQMAVVPPETQGHWWVIMQPLHLFNDIHALTLFVVQHFIVITCKKKIDNQKCPLPRAQYLWYWDTATKRKHR